LLHKKSDTMKLDLHTTRSAAPANTDALTAIFPEYGSHALDIPHFDADKHMYIVDQYTAASGNRSIMYVAVGRQLVVEFTMGLYHSWSLMNKVRLLIPDGKALKVVKTYDWEGTTYFNVDTLHSKIAELATEYAMDNIGMAGGEVTEQVSNFVGKLVADLLDQDVDSQLKDNGLEILKSYCRQMKVCKDFVTFTD